MHLRQWKKPAGFLLVAFLLLYTVLHQIVGVKIDAVDQFLNRYLNEQSLSLSSADQTRVKRVVDGDTIELENGEKVRYIGVNTPETVKPRAEVECFGKEASHFNKQLVEGKLVRLEKDVSDRDKYGRLLRFAYLEDGTFVNDVLVREGYAYASTFPPDVSKADQFKQAQQEARENKRGLWADDTCKGRK